MAYQFNVSALKVGAETSFGAGGSGAAFIETEGDAAEDLKRQYIEKDAPRLGVDGHTEGQIGPDDGSTLSITRRLRGYDAGTVSDAPALATDFTTEMRIASAALGGAYAGGYGAITGETSTVSNLVLTDASSFVDGQVIVVNGELTQVLEATTGGSEELSLVVPLSAAPTDGMVVYGTAIVYVADTYNATYGTSLYAEKLGQAADDFIEMVGMRPGSLKFESDPKGHFKMMADLGMASWSRAGSGGAPAGLTESEPEPPIWINGKLVVYNRTTDTRTEIDCSKAEIDYLLSMVARMDPNATYGIGEWDRAECRPQVTVDPIQGTEDDAAGWAYSYANKHKFSIVLQAGTTAGDIVGHVIPYAQIIQEPAKKDREGFVARELVFGALKNTINSTETSDTYDADDPADKIGLIAWG